VRVPVLSIGNLSTGGTGKTPLSIWLVRELQRRGLRPGLLSRGYRALDAGGNDEARLLAQACPGVPHVADPKRVRGARELLALGVDVVLLDDGFQHHKLARSQDWVLIDALRPWGLPRDPQSGESVRALLPRGLLREPLSSLRRADAIWITRCDAVPPEWLARLDQELEAAAPGIARLQCVHRPRRLIDEQGRELDLASLSGRTVRLASAIGNPEAFEHSVRALSARIESHARFPDHHAWTRAEAQALLHKELPLVVTEKDAVKLVPLGIPCWRLCIELEVTQGHSVVAALLDTLTGRHA
jgi:tetraacyldisaccharide 4'-kinase